MVFEVSQPPGCTHGNGTCERSVRFSGNDTHFTFDLEGNAIGWVAVGFTTTRNMVHLSVFCLFIFVIIIIVVIVVVVVVKFMWNES